MSYDPSAQARSEPIPAPSSIAVALKARANLHPDRPALHAGARIVTYGELLRRVEAAAAVLLSRGVERDDRVVLSAPSSPVFVFGYLATHLIGAVAVPLDPAVPELRRQELIERAKPRVVYGVAGGSPPDGQVIPISELEAERTLEGHLADPEPSDRADLLFTTGTSGHPKGVVLTHGNQVATATHINTVIGNGPDDVEVVPLPLSHSFGLGRVRCNLLAGGTVVLTAGFKLPGEIFSAMKRHRATSVVGVPAGIHILLSFGERGLGAFAEQLRYIEIGSAPMPLEQKRQLMALLPKTRLFMHYGLTEASRSAFIEFHRDGARLDTVGRASPGVEIEVRDESGAPCPTAARGELWIRGPHVAQGYWQDPARTRDTFVDGWVRTRDVASLDADGFISLHGRQDDLINVGGYKVSAEEVERVIEAHPGVLEAACIPTADPAGISGQVVHAYVVAADAEARPSDAELRAWLSARLEPHQVPAQLQWAEPLPRSTSGKLLRSALRDKARGGDDPK